MVRTRRNDGYRSILVANLIRRARIFLGDKLVDLALSVYPTNEAENVIADAIRGLVALIVER